MNTFTLSFSENKRKDKKMVTAAELLILTILTCKLCKPL